MEARQLAEGSQHCARTGAPEQLYKSFEQRIRDLKRPFAIRKKMLEDMLQENEQAQQHLIEILIPEGREECQQLCEHMYRRLPREIRDMVYAYIVGILNEGDREVYVCIKTDSRIVYHCSSPRYFKLMRHIWDIHNAGTGAGQELIEHWLGVSIFNFLFGTDTLKRFLTTYEFAPGCTVFQSVTELRCWIRDTAELTDAALQNLASLPQPSGSVKLRIDVVGCDVEEKVALTSGKPFWEYLDEVVRGMKGWDVEIKDRTFGSTRRPTRYYHL